MENESVFFFAKLFLNGVIANDEIENNNGDDNNEDLKCGVGDADIPVTNDANQKVKQNSEEDGKSNGEPEKARTPEGLDLDGGGIGEIGLGGAKTGGDLVAESLKSLIHGVGTETRNVASVRHKRNAIFHDGDGRTNVV